MNIAALLNNLDADGNQSNAGSVASGLGTGLLGGVAGGAITSALLSKKGRKHLGGIAKLGGVAALGGLAWKAYSEYNKTSSAEPSSAANDSWSSLTAEEFRPAAGTTYANERNLLLIRAMIAAAHADGTLDDEERQRIEQQLQQMDLQPGERALMVAEFAQPRPLRELAARVDDNETAIEVYLISLLTIDAQCVQGQNYLNALAFILELPPALIKQLEQQVASNAISA